jgi:plastocyanin
MQRLLLALLATAACHSSSKQIDATTKNDGKAVDSPRSVDAKVFMDAPPMSTVNVVANCTGVAMGSIAANITTSGLTFSPATATITAGQYVKFTTTGFHNFQNQPGAPPTATFVSGPAGAQTACLQFTVAGSYPFECVIHAGMGMKGTLTVN